MANATLTDAIPLEEEEAGTARGKRSTDNLGDDHVVGGEDEVEEKCRVAMWVSGDLRFCEEILIPGFLALPLSRCGGGSPVLGSA